MKNSGRSPHDIVRVLKKLVASSCAVAVVMASSAVPITPAAAQPTNPVEPYFYRLFEIFDLLFPETVWTFDPYTTTDFRAELEDQINDLVLSERLELKDL